MVAEAGGPTPEPLRCRALRAEPLLGDVGC